MITAPFNFVPLNEKVFHPPWSHAISQDLPFMDGECGEIEVTITTKSPTFIRDHEKPEKFCHVQLSEGKKRYYIPGSSIKGMLRNVMEIMSFSKMSFIDDTTYSLRDLKYNKYLKHFQNDSVRCGWLYLKSGQLKIEDCGTPYRIRYDEINSKFDVEFKELFMGRMDPSLKEANKKYKKLQTLIDQKKKKVSISDDIFSFSYFKNDKGRKIVRFDDNGTIKGKLVLTGHPSPRKESEKKSSGKIYDFVFPVRENNETFPVDEAVFENFKFAYFDGRNTQPKESNDWSFWKQKLAKGEKVPVFFHRKGNMITSFGLSYLYKFPYKHSVMEALFDAHLSDREDLAESLFGYTRKKEDTFDALKGRVHISHAFSLDDDIEPMKPRHLVLGSPKASYYPIYIVQNGNEYKTLMDDNAVLAGWKRYPVHRDFSDNEVADSRVATKITPLPPETVFKGKIRFHNLKKVEIGALLSALTFHETPDTFHNIGMAKPLGYGKISISISLKGVTHRVRDYLEAFESCMNDEIFGGEVEWHRSEQIVNLLSMATEQNDENLKYMELSDFAKMKNRDESDRYRYLGRYVDLEGVAKVEAKPLSTKESIEKYRKSVLSLKAYSEKIQRELEEKRRKEEEEMVFREELKEILESDNEMILENFIGKYRDRFDVSVVEMRLEQIREKINREKENKLASLEDKAKRAYEELMKKKGTKGFRKAKEKFVSKWKKEKENKGSKAILDLVVMAEKTKG